MPRLTLGELAQRVGGEAVGDAGRVVTAVRPLGEAGAEDLSFYHNRRYLQAALASPAGVLLVADPGPFPGRDLLVCRDPYPALAVIIAIFHPQGAPPPGIHSSAVVAASARVGPGVSIGPHCTIGERAVLCEAAVIGPGCVVGDGAEIGAGTLLHPRVVVESGCRVGARCVLHAGVVIGSDGYGFATVGGEHLKVPQVGVVVIEDDVELGANVCVDRATLGETRVGRGTKVDNLVQIAHNVHVGEHCLLVAQCGISGSTELADHVTVAGQGGIGGHLHLGSRTVVTAQAGVLADTKPGEMVSGIPARPQREWYKAMANLLRLDELRKRVRALEEMVARLGGTP
jgi:UDP-3-O-[3-hydroxymyristoyl] glucosamine N-acyltransferase